MSNMWNFIIYVEFEEGCGDASMRQEAIKFNRRDNKKVFVVLGKRWRKKCVCEDFDGEI